MTMTENELFIDPDYLDWLEERAKETLEREAWEASFHFSENY